MPAMQKLHDDYADRGVALFSINCRERGRLDPVKYLRDRGFSYPVLVNGRHAKEDTQLADGDRVILFPPIAGG